MRKDLAKWLQNTSMNPRATILIALSWVALLLVIHALMPTRMMESRVMAPALFKAREWMNKAPALDPSIKVFSLDDVTVSQIGRTDLTLEQWANVLEAIDSKHPKAIIIDAMFSLLDASQEPGSEKAIARLKTIQTPVYSGSYASSVEIYGRAKLPLDGSQFETDRYLDPKRPAFGTIEDQRARLLLPDFQSKLIYGPHPSVREVFRRTGHLLFSEQGNFFPLMRLSNTKVLPYVMLLPFDNVTINERSISIAGGTMEMAQDGSVPINYGKKSVYDESVKPLIHLLTPKWQSRSLNGIQSGDYIFIIPPFYTGNTDFKPSPIGLIPGAYFHLAVLSSILQKSTLRYVEIEPILILGFAAAVAFFGWWMNPATLILALLASSVAWIAGNFASFIYQGAMIPFILPQLSIMGVGISLLMQRIYITDRKARMIRHALEGIVRPEALAMLERNPERLSLSLDARERVISVMFIDIVGFSLMVENQLPRVAFEGLQTLITEISDCIHKHGGIVNKTLGDGLLCFFGYSLEENRETANHAEEALAAAIEIQTNNVPRILSSTERHKAVFPLRIGINTAAVFMGNLGAGERLDITVIGNGVNFAKRLESACLPHSVLVGPTTYELLRTQSRFGKPLKRLISIKHHESMVIAWEYDPFAENPTLRKRANEIYETSSTLNRLENRGSVDG